MVYQIIAFVSVGPQQPVSAAQWGLTGSGSNDWIGELPKVLFYEYLVLKPPPLITELLGTAVLREDKVEKHHFSADGETGTSPCVRDTLVLVCFCTFPKEVTAWSHLGG